MFVIRLDGRLNYSFINHFCNVHLKKDSTSNFLTYFYYSFYYSIMIFFFATTWLSHYLLFMLLKFFTVQIGNEATLTFSSRWNFIVVLGPWHSYYVAQTLVSMADLDKCLSVWLDYFTNKSQYFELNWGLKTVRAPMSGCDSSHMGSWAKVKSMTWLPPMMELWKHSSIKVLIIFIFLEIQSSFHGVVIYYS